MRTSWSPLMPKAIPEDCISLGGYDGDAFVCATSRTHDTDADALSPYSARIPPSTNESLLPFAALTSRTDDTDNGSPQSLRGLQQNCTSENDASPRKARRFSRRPQRYNTKDLVDIVDQRTQQVEELLKVGGALVTEKCRINDASHNAADSPNKGTLHGCEWENLHDEANARLEDIHNRLVTMAEEGSACTDEMISIRCYEDDSSVVHEVQELRQLVDVLMKELNEVKQGEAGLREEVTVLRARLSQVDRQAARASTEVQELRKKNGRSELQATHRGTSTKPKVPSLNLSRSISNQPSGSNERNARMQPRGALQSVQKSRRFMGENFFRK